MAAAVAGAGAPGEANAVLLAAPLFAVPCATTLILPLFVIACADWHAQFYSGLRLRNRLQRDNYTDIVDACQIRPHRPRASA